MKYAKYLFRLLVSLIILYLLIHNIEPGQIRDALAAVRVQYVVYAFVLVIAIRFVMAYRWITVLKAYSVHASFMSVLSIIFISNSIGHLVPGGIGIDVIRGYQLAKQAGDAATIAASVVIDRIFGLLSMLLIALLSALYGAMYLQLPWTLAGSILAALLGLLVFLLLATKLKPITADAQTGSSVFARGKRFMARFQHTLNTTRLPRSTLGSLFLLSSLVQVLRCLIFALIFASLGSDMDIVPFFIFVPLIFILMMLPISIGGLGVRESALYFFFTPYGATLALCTVAGLIFHLLQIISLLPGLVLYATKKE